MKEFTLTANKICVEFPGVKVLNSVDFEIKAGEIRAVAGANGAGKSTLMKVFSGVYTRYSGDIRCNGHPVVLQTPADAVKLGIHIVYQETDEAVLPDFTVAENLLMEDLALKKQSGMFCRRKKMVGSAKKILSELHVELNPARIVKDLSPAEKQLLLIAKAVHQKCRVLILDEPTAALSRAETDRLFQIMRRLAKEDGTAVIFISHRIQEILEICEKCTVLRDGSIAAELDITPDTKADVIIAKMLGRQSVPVQNADAEKAVPPRFSLKFPIAPSFIEVKNLNDRKQRIHNVSFYMDKGEIVGLAGLVGAGKTEICKALFGAEKRSSGEIFMNGQSLRLKNPAEAVRMGIALVPEERRKEGVFPTMDTDFNLGAAALADFCKFSFWQKKKMKKKTQEILIKIGIKCAGGKQNICFLSGGNQQKAVFGKWITADCKLYLLDEPMQGVDVGAKRELFALIRKLAGEGRSVLYASSDVSELMAVTDRIYVLRGGTVQGSFWTKNTDEQEIMRRILGAGG